ncbi:MAG TPA: SIMPL domain-containing protein [Vicinamibacterales bacterium]|nr:SIMPL domain-containing protein [Vicinamibacterales bacterium]
MKMLSFAVLGLLLSTSAALAQTAEPSQIIVSGEGVIKATPDQAWVSIGAESRSKLSKDAQQRNAEAMTSVMQKIAAFGITKEAIKTTAIDLQMEFDYANGKQTARGYVARNTVEVRVDDLTKLGDVLDAVVSSGATMIHGLRFDVKQREQAEAAALQSAVKNAMAKAQAIAAGAGRGLDRILKIEEVAAMREPMPMMRQYSMAKADASTPVAAGELEINAQVRLTIAIK